MRTNLRRGENQAGVDVGHRISCLAHALQSLAQEHDRIRALPLWIRWRKECTDVRRGDRSEKRVGYRVQQHIAIRVSSQSPVVREGHTPNFHRDARLEFMGVKAVADAVRGSSVAGRWHSIAVARWNEITSSNRNS